MDTSEAKGHVFYFHFCVYSTCVDIYAYRSAQKTGSGVEEEVGHKKGTKWNLFACYLFLLFSTEFSESGTLISGRFGPLSSSLV
jgi:hypothetical protein